MRIPFLDPEGGCGMLGRRGRCCRVTTPLSLPPPQSSGRLSPPDQHCSAPSVPHFRRGASSGATRSRREKGGSIVFGSIPALGQIYRLAARCGEGEHYKSRQLCTLPRINISGTQFQPPAQIGATAPATPRQSLPGSPMSGPLSWLTSQRTTRAAIHSDTGERYGSRRANNRILEQVYTPKRG
jgi:hypothetical protein